MTPAPAAVDLERDLRLFLAVAPLCGVRAIARTEARVAARARQPARRPPLCPAVDLERLEWVDSFLHGGTAALPVCRS